MSVAAPVWLVVAAAAAVAAWWVARQRAGLRPAAAGLAAAAAALLCGAPAGLAVPGPGGPVRVLCVDRSPSMQRSGDGLLSALAGRLAEGGARTGVIGFDRAAWIEQALRAGPPGAAVPPSQRSAGSHPGAALSQAVALLEGTGGEVVLLTDGRRTDSDDAALVAAGRRLAGAGGRLSVIAAGPPAGEDAAALALLAPAAATPGSRITIRCTVRLDRNGQARAALHTERAIWSATLRGAPGERRTVDVADTVSGAPGATVRYRLTASAAAEPASPDAVPQNGAREALVQLRGPRRLLAVSETPGGGPLARLLMGATEWTVQVVAPGALPADAAGYAGADAVLLEDAQRAAIGDERLAALADAVRAGLGLLQSGGPATFGAAGFGGDPLESVAAVRADPRSERPLALALVIDASGSMAEPAVAGDPAAGTKIDVAREAVQAAIAQLRPADHLLIVPFRAGTAAPIHIAGAAGRAEQAALRTALTAAGGTRVLPGLQQARAWLRSRDEPARHLCVISDGRDPALARGAADHDPARDEYGKLVLLGVGLSTIAAPDAAALRALVTDAGGRTASLGDYRRLPELLGRELRLSRGGLTWEGPGTPTLVAGAPDRLSGAPALQRALRTAAADGAQVWMQLPGDDARGGPLVAVRQSGLGRTAAFTSAPVAGWAPEWAGESGAALLRSLVAEVAANAAAGALEARVLALAGTLRVSVTLPAGSAVSGGLSLTDGASGEWPLRPIAPGRVQAELPLTAQARLGAIVAAPGGRVWHHLPLPGGWGPEWDAVGADRAGCERIAELAGGTVIDGPALYRPAPRGGRGHRRLDGWLILAGLGCLLALFGSRRGR